MSTPHFASLSRTLHALDTLLDCHLVQVVVFALPHERLSACVDNLVITLRTKVYIACLQSSIFHHVQLGSEGRIARQKTVRHRNPLVTAERACYQSQYPITHTLQSSILLIDAFPAFRLPNMIFAFRTLPPHVAVVVVWNRVGLQRAVPNRIPLLDGVRNEALQRQLRVHRQIDVLHLVMTRNRRRQSRVTESLLEHAENRTSNHIGE